MDNIQEMIQFIIDNHTVISWLVSALLGGGILWKLLPKLYNLYRKRYSFSIEMAMINKKNKLLAKQEGIYVARPELEAALNIKYETCVIVGPAGSGKTRFALNLIKKNRLFSKYYYVYIHKNNASYFVTPPVSRSRTATPWRRASSSPRALCLPTRCCVSAACPTATTT